MAAFRRITRIQKPPLIGPIGILLLLAANCQFVVSSVTWTAPPPAWKQMDQNNIRTVDMQVLIERTQVLLRWNYNLSVGSDLRSTTFSFDDGTGGDDVGNIFPNVGSPSTYSINPAYQSRFALHTSDVATLIIKKATEKEEGTYQCKLGVVGNTWAYKIRVNITVPAKLTNVTGDQIVLEGTNPLFFCEATGKPTPNITWTKDGSNSGVLHHGPLWNFKNIDRNDSGTFRCTADNGFGESVTKTVNVDVTYPPKIVHFQSERIVPVKKIGKQKYLNCGAEGNPQPTYTWTPCDPKKHVCNQSALDISDVDTNDIFTCTVTNKFDSDARNVSVFIGDHMINVTFVITSESCTNGKYDGSSLLKKLSEKMAIIFDNKLGYKGTQLTNVRCGSITVELALEFNSTTKEQDVVKILQNAAENGTFGEYSVNASSIKGARPDVEGTTAAGPTTPASSSDSIIWLIVGLVLGVFAVIVVGIICWCMYKKKKCKGKDPKVHCNEGQEKTMEDDHERDYTLVERNYAEVGPNANYRASNPPSVPPLTYEVADTAAKKSARKGGRDQEQALPEYAVVDKTKKKKKTPKPGELQYADLGEFSRGEPKTTMPRSSATDTVYADIKPQ